MLIVVLLATGIYWAKNNGHLKKTPLEKPLGQVASFFGNFAKQDIFNNLPWMKGKSETQRASSANKNKSNNEEMVDEQDKKSNNWQQLGADLQNQTQTLSERAKETGSHVQQVLGSSVQVNEQEKQPIHQRAFDYGRYIYCKAVVEEWENK